MPAAGFDLYDIDLSAAYVTKAVGNHESRLEVSNDRLTIRNVSMNDTASIQCYASNDYGHVRSSVYLNVYGKCSLQLIL